MTNSQPLLVVFDGDNLAHRAHHGYSRTGMTSPNGEPTHALHGFLMIAAGALTKLPVRPTGIIFAFDGRDNERRARWPEYKANRSEKDPGLVQQLALLPRLLADAGFCIEKPRHWEADDVAASAALTASLDGWQTVIVTSDRDSFALIDENTSVLRLVNGIDSAKLIGVDELVESIGVHPSKYLSYAALRGDTSDNLPGVPGVGEKTAAKIVAAGAVAEIAANPDVFVASIGKGPAAKVAANLERWLHNVEVMTPKRDLTMDLRAVTLEAFDPDRVADAFAPYGVTVSVRKLAAALGAPAPTAATLPPSQETFSAGDPGPIEPPAGGYDDGPPPSRWDDDVPEVLRSTPAPAPVRPAPKPVAAPVAQQGSAPLRPARLVGLTDAERAELAAAAAAAKAAEVRRPVAPVADAGADVPAGPVELRLF